MYAEDVSLLVCPKTREPLSLGRVDQRDEDGEILAGELVNPVTGQCYPIVSGIPRFVSDREYNKSWDFKWTQIDRGRGLNYRIVDQEDPAYRIHDIFDRNNHGGQAFCHAHGGVALDIGCGVGQYSWRLLKEYQPAKMVSLDLTGGVDMFRKIMLERFPEFKKRLLLVQASVFEMPFRDETFDYVFSLGVLMHTGNTREAIRQATRVVKEKGQVNLWVYCPFTVHIDVGEAGRKVPFTLMTVLPHLFYTLWVMFQINLFRHLPHRLVLTLLKLGSSEIWYRLCRLPVVGYLFRLIFGTVMHPDRDYRFINNYDGWCNRWADTWSEQELFPVFRDADIVIKGMSDWPTGIWGEKIKGVYR